jgi:hypothetical protein
VILLSDGEDQALEDTAAAVPRAQLLARIDELVAKGWRFFTVGIGSQAGGEVPNVTYEGKPVHSALDVGLLRELAEHGRGQYFMASASSPVTLVDRLLAAIEQADEGRPTIGLGAQNVSTNTLNPEESYFQIPLAIAIVLLLGVLLLPDVTDHKRTQ